MQAHEKQLKNDLREGNGIILQPAARENRNGCAFSLFSFLCSEGMAIYNEA
jgi:hypothetical protein